MNHNISQPLVTVAMVTYNSAKYVEIAIQSILASSYSNFELIISDDCSTDSTWELIQTYKDERIVALRNENNIGEYPNRNKCIDLAKGKYFLFIDGDDILYPHGLENYVFYAEQAPESGMIIQKTYYNYLVFPVEMTPNDTLFMHFFVSGILSSSFSSNFFVTTILKKCGKLSNDYKSGDNEIRYRIALRHKILFISGWNTWPRETPGQASQSLKGLNGLLESYKQVLDIVKNEYFPLDKIHSDIILTRLEKQLSRTALKNLLKMNFSEVRKIKKATGLTLFGFLKKTTSKVPNKIAKSKFSPATPLLQNKFYVPQH